MSISRDQKRISFSEFMREKSPRLTAAFAVDLKYEVGVRANDYRTPLEWETLYQAFATKDRTNRALRG